MAEVIKIKRSSGNATYPALAAGELAYSDLRPGQLGVGKVGGGNDSIGPKITFAAGAPASTPEKVGDVYVNSTNDDIYIAKGTASSADWSQVNGAGSGDMLKSENLSGLANYTTARSNLGLGALAELASVDTGQITDNAVTYAKFQDMAANSLLGNNTGAPADPIAMTVAQAQTLLNVADGATANVGDMQKTENLSGLANYTTARTNLGLGSLAELSTVGTTNITNDAVTYAKLENAAANSFLGNNTGSAADTIAMTVAQAKTLLAIAVADLTDAGALAALNTVGTSEIDNLAVTEGKLATALQNKINASSAPSKLDATTAPGVNNDINDTVNASDGIGFQVGSLWIDTTADEAYRCVDNTDAAAVWISTTLESSELGALALLNTVGTTEIDNDAVTYAKLQNVSQTDVLLGRDTAGAGDAEEITMTALLTMLNGGATTANYIVKINGTNNGITVTDTIDGGTWA